MSKVAVVTGGASGLGLAICHELARSGNAVAVLDIDGEGAGKAAAALGRSGTKSCAAEVDVSDRSSVERAVTQVQAELGPVGILVTSAGVTGFTPFEQITLEAWNRMIAVNLTGTFHCVQASIGDMVEAGWGRIVTISSSGAQTGAPRMAHYVASKGGVIALTRTLAREYASRGITVNTIAPSSIDSPMSRQGQADGNLPGDEQWAARIPVGRLGTGEDIGVACGFLCSEQASYITGQLVGVNGGAVIC